MLAEGAFRLRASHCGPGSGCLNTGKLTRHHTDMGQSPDPRADSLSRCRGRVTVAESTLGSRGEHTGRGRVQTPSESLRAGSGCLSMGMLARNHTYMGQSPDPGPDSLSRCRGRVTVAESTLGSRGEHASRGRVRDSERVTAGGGRVFEHGDARPIPYGHGTVA